jgi:hypothetical protein
MVENVKISGEDLDKITNAFGLLFHINLDAAHLSPMRRDRNFWTNIPLSNCDYQTQFISPDCCFQEGHCLPGQIMDKNMVVKASCLMGSKTRINDKRMYIVDTSKKKGKKYPCRLYRMDEREKLMGYPIGYIETPVQQLFQTLVDNGLCKIMDEDSGWKVTLDKKYHVFAGNYHGFKGSVSDYHRFGNSFPPNLMLAPPVDSNKNPYFFDADEYAKHLIGMAYSVPVVEHILSPLSGLFETQSYPNFQYNYVWIKNDYTEESMEDRNTASSGDDNYNDIANSSELEKVYRDEIHVNRRIKSEDDSNCDYERIVNSRLSSEPAETDHDDIYDNCLLKSEDEIVNDRIANITSSLEVDRRETRVSSQIKSECDDRFDQIGIVKSENII